MPNHPESETVHTDAQVEAPRQQTREMCTKFSDEYWRTTDLNRRYPQEFVDTLTAAGLLSALILTEYCGLGIGVTKGQRDHGGDQHSGGHSAARHAQIYTMNALLKHGSQYLKNT